MERFDHLWSQARPAFRQQRIWARARVLGVSTLTCLGRHTITGLLTTSGQQYADWTAAYRLFEYARIDEDAFWLPVRHGVLPLLPAGGPVVAALDDTLVGKRGRRVVGAAWRRDPLGPRFHVNLTWAQRFLQLAVMVPEGEGPARARAIPVDLQHCPPAKRPGKGDAPEQWAAYSQAQRALRLPAIALGRLRAFRAALDADPAGALRPLVVAVDGGYTNATLFRQPPERTALIGRLRKDAALYAPPAAGGRGRPRCYGDRLPTPEQYRQDANIPWQTVRAYAAGMVHDFEVKVVQPVRWRGVGARDLRLVIIRPLAYRPTKSHQLLYRQPAYLLCTDPAVTVEQILQAYLWRWEAEVAFRDQKSLLGMGEAQLRTAPAVATAPTFTAGMYAYLHLAALQADCPRQLAPKPKWNPARPTDRWTTSQLQGYLRAELWGRALGVTFTDFVTHPPQNKKPAKSPAQFPDNPFPAMVFAMK